MKNPAPPAPLGATEVRLEISLHAAQARVWQALVKETSAWWPKTFHTSERTQRFVIEPRLGGMVGEISGKGQGLAWFRVIGVEAPNYLPLAGYLMPPWGGPASSLLRLALSAVSATETKLEVTDSTFGKVGDCDNEDGWRQIFAEHFRQHIDQISRRRK